MKLPEYSHHLQGLSHKNKGGKFINKILCYHENLLLQEAIRAVNVGNVAMPAFDGFLGTQTLVPDKTIEKTQQLSWVGKTAKDLNLEWTSPANFEVSP